MNPILGLIDRKTLKIIYAFLKNKDRQMYLREISRMSGVPPATTLRLLKKLCQQNIIKETRISKFTFYTYKTNRKLEDSLR